MTVCPPLVRVRVCKATDVGKQKSNFRKLSATNSPARPKRGRRSKSSGSRRIDESTATLYELSPGIAQKISTTITPIEDRAYLLRTRKTVFHAKK